MTSKSQHFWAVFSWVTLGIASLFVAICVAWMVYPYDLITFNKLPYPVESKVVYQGGILHYEVDYCKNTTRQPESITREFVDGIIFTSNDVRANVTTGCGKADVTTQVPTTLPAGKYRLRLTIVYKPNPIRTITYVNESEEFIVKDAVNPSRDKIIEN